MRNLNTGRRNGWSLILLLFILASFVATFPLIATFSDSRGKGVTVLERWTQWQKAKEGVLQIAVARDEVEKATINYALPGGNTLDIVASTSIPVLPGSDGQIVETTANVNLTEYSGFFDGASWSAKLSAASWALPFSSRKSLAVLADEVDETLTDFPVLVTIEDTDVADGALPDGSDIRFADQDNNLLEFEMASYQVVGGKAIARFWVKIPSLNSSANTSIFMYYGSTAASALPALEWDGSGYRAIWHLSETGNGTTNEFKDSSGNNNHGTGGAGVAAKVPSQDATGPLSASQKFDGIEDFIAVNDNSSLSVPAMITLSAWVKPETAQKSFNFTNAGATGRVGPTQAQINLAYAATALAGNIEMVADDGIQIWTVPENMTSLTLETYGAQGGRQRYSPGYPGGLGARMKGDFNFQSGAKLSVIVGQMGEDTRVATEDNAAPGGGGGSFVFFQKSDSLPLMAAGGGGGGGRHFSSLYNGDASTNGNPSGSGISGGTAGNGAPRNTGGWSYWAGGGSGWLTDGTGGNNSVIYSYSSVGYGSAQGGRAPRNGAFGGIRWSDGWDEGGDGGFGGGGGGGSDNMGTGGGGGYSGGAGAKSRVLVPPLSSGNPVGGGGGSYNAGTNQDNASGVNSGHGKVTITPKRLIVSKGYESYALWLDDDLKLRGFINGTAITTTSPLIADQWQYVAMTYNGSAIKLYVNGIENSSIPLTGGIVNNTQKVYLGSGVFGAITETRIAETARSAAWLKFEYQNITSANNQLEWGAEENR